MITIPLNTVKSDMLEKSSAVGRDWTKRGQRGMLSSYERGLIQEKNEIPFLSLKLQVAIIKASIHKMLVA
jgi:hypothetical protein